MRRAGFPHGSHNEKALIEILETHPRDEILQVPVDELFDIAMGILYLGERQRVGLFARRDTFGRFLSCLVFVPRDRFNTENRRRIEAILRRAFNATSIDYTTRVSESVLVRLHYQVYVEPGRVPAYDVREIETLIVAATRSWGDELEAALIQDYGEERGNALRRTYGDAFPPAYRAGGELRADRVRESFKDCFVRAWRGDVEDDGFNRLLLRAGLTWRQITVLRAIGKYLRQAGTTFSDAYVERALVSHPQLAGMFVELFGARFDPARPDPERAAQIRAQIEQAIDAVESLDEDRILRNFLAVIRAMLRTNYFQ